MKSLKIISLVCLVLCVLSSCSKTDYQNVIPKDANFVASVNLKAVAEESDFANSGMAKTLKNSIGLLVSGKDKKAVEGIIDDPSAMGIDFTCPAYVFGTSAQYYGATMKVSDADDLEDFVTLLSKQNIASKPQDKDGMMVGTLSSDVVYAYNKTALLLLINAANGSVSQSKKTAAQLMAQSEDDSFVSTDAYGKISDKADDAFALYANMSALPASVGDVMASFLPKKVKKGDIEVVASLDFGKGTATLTSTLWGKTDEAQKLIDEVDGNMYKIKGDFTDMPTENTAAWGCIGVKGEWLLSQLKANKESSQIITLIERGIDIEQMLRAVDGDFAVTVPRNYKESVGESFMNFMSCAQLKNTDFLGDVDYWKSSMRDYGFSMNATGKDTYLVSYEDKRIAWGVDGKNLFFGSELASKDCMNSPKSHVLSSYESDIKDSKAFVYVDLKQVMLPSSEAKSGLVKFGPNLKALILKSSSASDIQIIIENENKDDNFLKGILK